MAIQYSWESQILYGIPISARPVLVSNSRKVTRKIKDPLNDIGDRFQKMLFQKDKVPLMYMIEFAQEILIILCPSSRRFLLKISFDS